MLLISAALHAQKDSEFVSRWFVPQEDARSLVREGVMFISIKGIVYVFLLDGDHGLWYIKPVPPKRVPALKQSDSVYIYLAENKL